MVLPTPPLPVTTTSLRSGRPSAVISSFACTHGVRDAIPLAVPRHQGNAASLRGRLGRVAQRRPPVRRAGAGSEDRVRRAGDELLADAAEQRALDRPVAPRARHEQVDQGPRVGDTRPAPPCRSTVRGLTPGGAWSAAASSRSWMAIRTCQPRWRVARRRRRAPRRWSWRSWPGRRSRMPPRGRRTPRLTRRGRPRRAGTDRARAAPEERRRRRTVRRAAAVRQSWSGLSARREAPCSEPITTRSAPSASRELGQPAGRRRGHGSLQPHGDAARQRGAGLRVRVLRRPPSRPARRAEVGRGQARDHAREDEAPGPRDRAGRLREGERVARARRAVEGDDDPPERVPRASHGDQPPTGTGTNTRSASSRSRFA